MEQNASVTQPVASSPLKGARPALILLLLINLFNYIDRQVLAAVESDIQKEFFPTHPRDAEFWMGMLATAFMVTYMITAPIFGWLADRTSRWIIVGASVLLWSLATGGSGLAALFGGFGLLMATRALVGVGEAGYGPAAPTLISDFYPVERRGAVLAWFYMAIPVGSALGYGIGMVIAQHFHWSRAFYAVVAPGIVLGIAALFMRDPPRGQADALDSSGHGAPKVTAKLSDYLVLLRIPSYLLNCAGMAAMTFAIGGVSYWMPRYLVDVRQVGEKGTVGLIFGGITVVAGLSSTLLGGLVGDYVRRWIPSSYFLVSGIAILIACPFILLMMHAQGMMLWTFLFIAEFFLFFNTGPSNTALANVAHPSIRATAFALNILVIHALGDAISPPLLGWLGHTSWNHAFGVVAGMMAAAGVFWLWGCRYLERDTKLAGTRLRSEPSPL